MYIDAARTMYSEGRISIDHFKATAKSLPKLVKLSEKTPYFDSEGWETQVPCVNDILEMDSAVDMIGVASYPSPPKHHAPAIQEEGSSLVRAGLETEVGGSVPAARPVLGLLDTPAEVGDSVNNNVATARSKSPEYGVIPIP